MADSRAIGNHVLESILKDLNFLKEHNLIPSQTFEKVVGILPSNFNAITTETNKPPLPTRKSTTGSPNINHSPTIIPQSREINNINSLPKLPIRNNNANKWQQQQQQSTMVAVMPPISQSESEKTTATAMVTAATPPPPAYTQKPIETNSLATVKALYDYHGEDPSTDLSFKKDDIIQVTEYVNADWWKGTLDSRSGIFPQNHVEKVEKAVLPAEVKQRPWVPPTSAKPSFSTSSSTTTTITSNYGQQQQQQYSNNTNNTNTLPYSYPPPPAMYQPPPAQVMYGQPSSSAAPIVASSSQQQQEEVHADGGDKKVQNMAKKFGGHVATGAAWGVGGAIGSEFVRAIF